MIKRTSKFHVYYIFLKLGLNVLLTNANVFHIFSVQGCQIPEVLHRIKSDLLCLESSAFVSAFIILCANNVQRKIAGNMCK